MTDIKNPPGAKFPIYEPFPVCASVVAGYYFGSAEQQKKRLEQQGVKVKRDFTELLDGTRRNIPRARPQRLDVVDLTFKDIGLRGEFSFSDIHDVTYGYELLVYEREFASWVWENDPYIIPDGESRLVISAPVRLVHHRHIPRMSVVQGRRVLETRCISDNKPICETERALFVQDVWEL